MDTLTVEQRSLRMSLVRARGSKAELAVRRLAHRLGYRFRLHRRDLPGTPDLVFPRRRKIIFVHGCFWHRHDDPRCPLARTPKSRLDFWLPKFELNVMRDKRAQQRLNDMGWKFLVVWECALRDMEQLGNDIAAFLEGTDDARD